MRKKDLVILFILLLALSLRLINLNQSFWLDEAAQILESSRPLQQQLEIFADFHPPFYHLVLHFWLYLGKSEITARILSVFFALFSIVILYKLSVYLKGQREGLITALFLTLSPYHVWYSQEARPYMLFLFLSILSTFLLIRKKWLLYTVSTLACLYTLYFAPFLIFSHGVYILLFQKKSLKKFLLIQPIFILSFLPWIPFFLRQLSIGIGGSFSGWSKVVSIETFKILPLTFAKFIFGRGSIDNNLLYGLVILPSFLIFVYCCYKLFRDTKLQFLTVLFFLPLLAANIASFYIPVVAPQRLIFLLPIFYLIIGVGLFNFGKKLRLLIISIVVITSLAGLFQYYLNKKVQRENWRDAVSYVEHDNSLNSIVLFVFPEPFAPYELYSRGNINAIGIAPKFIITDYDLVNLTPKINNKNRIYLFQYLTGLTDKDNKTASYLQSLQFQLTDIKNFDGVGFVYVYDK